MQCCCCGKRFNTTQDERLAFYNAGWYTPKYYVNQGKISEEVLKRNGVDNTDKAMLCWDCKANLEDETRENEKKDKLKGLKENKKVSVNFTDDKEGQEFEEEMRERFHQPKLRYQVKPGVGKSGKSVFVEHLKNQLNNLSVLKEADQKKIDKFLSPREKWNLKMDVESFKKELTDLQNTAEKLDDRAVEEICNTQDYPFSKPIDEDYELNNWCAELEKSLTLPKL